MHDAYTLIRQAIIDKNIITATYDGHHREMCPHAIGHKHGRQMALFYQFAGSSFKGLGPIGSFGNWRCVFVDKLENVRVRAANGEWYTASDHSRKQTCIDVVDVEVAH
ncbi:MAG TPA: hypothetical protein VNA69_16285 [Thermoanaerobaculia bacterium]|nr:hypothetical protein [Thermoanaerobaculia bacterium]